MHSRPGTTRDKRLSCMLTTSGWSKAEATNRGTYENRNLHIQVEENGSHFSTHDHQLEFTCQQLVTIFGSTCLCGFVTSVIQICHNMNVDLLSYLCGFVTVSFRFVTIFIWLCEKMHMNIMQICHNLYVVLSKAAHEYKLV